MTTTVPAAAAAAATQIISSPIKPSSPNSEGVVGPRVFTDLQNYQHAVEFVRQSSKLNSEQYRTCTTVKRD
jgi:hypothetical protein